MRTLLLLLIAALAATACADNTPAAPGAPERVNAEVPYRLDAPDAVIQLAGSLREISGLTILPSGNLGAVQDERGIIYEIDPLSGQVVAMLPFASAGDFEGIELAPDAVWVLRSDGDLYRVSRDSTGTPAAQKFETALGSSNDTEGLAYDPTENRLLIACKEDPGYGLDRVRSIYAFSLDTETLSERPVFLLERTQVDAEDSFKPSALSIHPATGNLYVLSSVRKALAVMAPDGTFIATVPLDPALFPQPEGIAFAADGTLFIANEGPTGAGTILRFSPTDA